MTISEDARALDGELRALKENLHRHPELSFRETRTTSLLREKLSALGLTLIDLGLDTGAAAVLRGGKPGPAVALRADIDAIEQQEPPSPEASEHDGVMHACGHDFHTTCLYGAAKLLAARREELPGSVVFLFQPAEETLSGAKALLNAGLWERLPEKPACIFGLHNRPELPVGQAAVMAGPIMAGKTSFRITLRGTAGHGGSPHKCTDVIVCASSLVMALQTIVSRSTDPLEPLVVGVCSIHAGTEENFVPSMLTMTGSIRYHSDDVLRTALDRLSALTRTTADGYGCTADVQFFPEVPVTYNSPSLLPAALAAAEQALGKEGIVAPRPGMGSEDFAVYGQDIPAFFYWLGSGFPGKDCAPWHSERFRTDDDALSLGAALLAESAMEALSRLA